MLDHLCVGIFSSSFFRSKSLKRSTSVVRTKIKEPTRAPLHVEISRDADIRRGVKRCGVSTDAEITETYEQHEDSPLSQDVIKKILALTEEDHHSDDEAVDNLTTDKSQHPSLGDEMQGDQSTDQVEDKDLIAFCDTNCITDAEKFIDSNPTATRDNEKRLLSDLILEKLRQENVNMEGKKKSPLDTRIVEVYDSIGTFLSKYKSGKLPKAFKIIPTLENWEEILCLTKPVDWTPNAMCEAVRIFSSNLNPRMAQRFYNLVLLPALRDNVQTYKKMNFHYYQALKLAMYKPSAWFQGILFPLLMNGCTLREAVIFGSVLAKLSIPPLHVAAALVRCANLHHGNTAEWSICTSYILNVLLNKKCSLPRMAVDRMVEHFMTFVNDSRQLPVLWHQSLLTFVQRYKLTLTSAQKNFLRDLLKIHSHYMITPDIRLELCHSEFVQVQKPTVMDVLES